MDDGRPPSQAPEPPAAPSPPPWHRPTYPVEVAPSGARKGVEKISYTHDGMIDHILANPAISQGELAHIYGYSTSWVCQIMASDAFQARMYERREEIVDPAVRLTMKERFDALVLRSMEILQEKLNRPSDKVSDQLVLQTLGLSSKAAGYGARLETPPQAPVNVHLHLEAMADNLTALLRRKKAEALPAIDVPPSS
jgi:hypothetical protein